jgi:hypothetical protein
LSLAKIHKGKQPKPRRIMIYGVHGIGKSTFGAMSPSPIFVPTEDGISDIDVDSFPLAETYDQFLSNLSTLATEEHEYKTCVVDSMDWLEQLIWKKVCQQHNINNIEDIDYGKGYTFAINPLSEVLQALNFLRGKVGMHVILIAHAAVTRFNNPETESYDRYSPKMHKTASALVQEWCDEVLFANYQTYTRSEDQGFGKDRNIATGSGERILRCSERPAHVAKNRCGLPDEIALDWREYARYAFKQGDAA